MKKIVFLALMAMSCNLILAQSSFDFSTNKATGILPTSFALVTDTAPAPSPISFTTVKKVGLIGIGNLNTESFKELNASGKLSGFIRPIRKEKYFWNINFSYNVNASNSDSLLASTFLFPDVGENSFYIGTDVNSAFIRNTLEAHLVAPFWEFSLKNIKVERDKEERFFNTLSYTIGLRYQYFVQDGDDNFSLTTSCYFSLIKVPDEDVKDYRYLFTQDENSPLNSSIKSIGWKTTFQVNKFQIFADLRHVLGNETNVPIRELRGFNANIGILFNAVIFEK